MVNFTQFICFVLLALGWQQQSNANPLLAGYAAFKVALNVYKDIKAVKEIFTKKLNPADFRSKVDVEILNNFHKIDYEISHLNTVIQNIGEESSLTGVNRRYEELERLFYKINNVYRKFLNLVDHTDEANPDKLEQFKNDVTSSIPGGFQSILQEMHDEFHKISDASGKTLLRTLSEPSNSLLMCRRGQSYQQIVLELYEAIFKSDIQGLAVSLFALKEDEKSNATYEFESMNIVNEFQKRMNSTHDAVKNVIASTPRELRNCGQEASVPDVTYGKLQEIFQGYVYKEKDTYSLCDVQCEHFNHKVPAKKPKCTTSFCTQTHKDTGKLCIGNIRECGKVDKSVSICVAPRDSEKAYDWIEYKPEKEAAASVTFGNSAAKTCKNKILDFGGELEFFSRCDYCMCTCESTLTNVDRYFSLKEAVSDTENMKVVTGARLRKRNNTFYIEIEQGVLGPYGVINGTAEWKETIDIGNVNEVVNGEKTVYSVDWDHKVVYLDDLEPPTAGDVLTGLRFGKVGNDLRLEIRTRGFDYESGKFVGGDAWRHNKLTRSVRIEYRLSESDDPLRGEKNVPVSKSTQYVTFQRSDLKKDVGSHTIPFIDLQSVSSPKPVPLSGAGLILKRDVNLKTGGFLALKLLQYDYTSRL